MQNPENEEYEVSPLGDPPHDTANHTQHIDNQYSVVSMSVHNKIMVGTSTFLYFSSISKHFIKYQCLIHYVAPLSRHFSNRITSCEHTDQAWSEPCMYARGWLQNHKGTKWSVDARMSKTCQQFITLASAHEGRYR